MESWRNRKTLILSRTDMMGLLTPDEYNACVEHAYHMHGDAHDGREGDHAPSSGRPHGRSRGPADTHYPLQIHVVVWSHFSSVSSVRGTRWAIPALATTACSGPYRS